MTRPPRCRRPVPSRRSPRWPPGPAPWRSSLAGPPPTRCHSAAWPSFPASSCSGTTAHSAGRRASSARPPRRQACSGFGRRCPGCWPRWGRRRGPPSRTRAPHSPCTPGARPTPRPHSTCCASRCDGWRAARRSPWNPGAWCSNCGRPAWTRGRHCGNSPRSAPPARCCSAATTSETSPRSPPSVSCAAPAYPVARWPAAAPSRRGWPRPPTSWSTARPAWWSCWRPWPVRAPR